MRNKLNNDPHRILKHYASVPFILGMSVPLVILDATMEIYHRVAFPLYGIPVNKRSKYIRLDRQKLSYLSGLDKAWCTYCGYANGVTAYSVKIAGDTEAYWCGVKHKPVEGYVEPKHHKDFLEYGDEKAYQDFLAKNK